MVKAEFFVENGGLIGFSIRGHAGYAAAGNDIVCASVSSAVQFASNLITECFHTAASVTAVGDTVNLLLSDKNKHSENRESAVKVLDALKLHLELLSEEYHGTIETIFSEV